MIRIWTIALLLLCSVIGTVDAVTGPVTLPPRNRTGSGRMTGLVKQPQTDLHSTFRSLSKGSSAQARGMTTLENVILLGLMNGSQSGVGTLGLKYPAVVAADGVGSAAAVGTPYFVGTIIAEYTFQDTFEANNMNLWPNGTDGTFVTAAAPGYTNDQGNYVAKMVYPGTASNRYYVKTLASPLSDFWCSFWIAFSSTALSTAQWDNAEFMEFYPNGEGNYVYFLGQTGPNPYNLAVMGVGVDSSSPSVYGDFSPAAATWYQFKVHIVAGTSPNGHVSIYYRPRVNMAESWTQLGSTWDGTMTAIQNIRIGRVAGTAAATTPTVYYDNVQVAGSDVW